MDQLRQLVVTGTRPEAIKLAPVIREARCRTAGVETLVCFTGQHREMLAQVAEYFEIQPEFDLQLMQPNQSLSALTARCVAALDDVVTRCKPGCVVAQGDTSTVLAASLVAFYRQTPFVHVEAGLRTGDLGCPWPEEFNRRVAGLSAALHCAPTERAALNLLREGVSPDTVFVTGNTVVDALLWTVARERRRAAQWRRRFPFLGNRPVVLITGHRRENFGGKLEAICRAIRQLAGSFPGTEFVYPVHLNPNVREPVFRLLEGLANVHLVEPCAYPEFVWLMDRSTLILTDSGGIQEEAPSLKKPVLVMRDNTERPEAVEAGAVELVGTSAETIVAAASQLLSDPQAYARRQIAENPYGDGQAARRIVDLIAQRTWESQPRRAAVAA